MFLSSFYLICFNLFCPPGIVIWYLIAIFSTEHLPVFALHDDSIVEIQGEPAGVHKAVEIIAGHLRKFLVDRSVIGVFEKLVSILLDLKNL